VPYRGHGTFLTRPCHSAGDGWAHLTHFRVFLRAQIANIPPEYRALCTELLASVRRQCLHARSLAFNHPTTGIPLAFESPLPADFAGVVARLEAAYGGAKKASQ